MVIDQYGEWPDYVEEVVSGEIWLVDPLCPGPENIWIRDPVPYKSEYTELVWWKYTRREKT